MILRKLPLKYHSGVLNHPYPLHNNTKNMSTTTTPTPAKLCYTRKEAAAALGLSAVTIDRLTEKGLLKANRATRRPLYSHTELTRFAEGKSNTNPAEKK
jgi:hypothetical protein